MLYISLNIFRISKMPAARYKAAGGKALGMLQDVRWNTMEHSLESYLQNWPIILQVCEKHRGEIDTNIGTWSCAKWYLCD